MGRHRARDKPLRGRTLATKLLHDQGEHLKTVQQVLGHKDAATTTIYQDVPEEEMRQVLYDAGESYESQTKRRQNN